MHVLESIATNPKPTPKTLRTCALIKERLRRPLPDSWAATNREAMGSVGVRVVLSEEGSALTLEQGKQGAKPTMRT